MSGSPSWSSRRSGSWATSSSSPARRRRWCEREREKLATWREQREVLSRKLELLGCGDADAPSRRVTHAAVAGLRADGAAAWGPSRRGASAARSRPSRTRCGLPGFRRRRRFRLRRGDLRGRTPNQGAGTGDLEQPQCILSPTREDAEGALAVATGSPSVPVRDGSRTACTAWSFCPVSPTCGATAATGRRGARSPPGRPRPGPGSRAWWWTGPAARPAPGALIVAMMLPDSLPYRGLADSSGHFSLGPLPRGPVRGERRAGREPEPLPDPREAFDSVRAARSDSTLRALGLRPRHEPAAGPRDQTAGQRLGQRRADPAARSEAPSPADGGAAVAPARLHRVRVASILPKPLDDSLHGRQRRRNRYHRADTTAVQDTTPPPPRPGARARPARRRETAQLTSRPALTSQLVLRPASPWRPGSHYTVEIRGVRNVTGVSGDVVGTLVIPEPPPRDTTARHGFAATGRRHDPGEAGTRQQGRPSRRPPARTREARADEAGARQAEADSVPVNDRRRGAAHRWTASCSSPRCRRAARPPRRASRWWMQCASRWPRPALGAPAPPRAGRPTIRERLADRVATESPTRPQRDRRGAPHQSRTRTAGACGGGRDGGGRERVQQPRVRPGHRRTGQPERSLPRLASRRDRGRGCAWW